MVHTYVFDIDAKYWCLDVEWWSGMGDWSGFMDKIDEVVPMDQQPELLQKLTKGNITLRIMYEQFQNIQNMGPLSQLQMQMTW